MRNGTSALFATQGPLIDAARDEYSAAGLTPIPLEANSKVCAFNGWPDAHADELWDLATPDANIALRCGDGGLCVLDADDSLAAEELLRWHEGLGLRPVGAYTKRGRHFYLRTSIPPAFTSSALVDAKGELRGRRSYVVAPPSFLKGWQYQMAGRLEDIPTVDWVDLSKLAPCQLHPTEGWDLPFRLLHRKNLPARARNLIRSICVGLRGQSVGGYRTCSEALCAVFNMVHSSGWTWEDINPLVNGIYPENRLREDFQRTFHTWKTEGLRPQLERR